jgi:hypothetical protein
MSTPSGIARVVLDRLVDDDLIEVEAHDEAITQLTTALEQAETDDLVGVITGFLDEHEVIDEIYGTDTELESAIKAALSMPAA